MSVTLVLGVVFALATALASVVGFLYKQRGAVASPPVDSHRPIRSSLVLFRSRPYVLGILVAQGSWILHVTALTLAPISLVQTVIAGGLVLVNVIADRMFGFPITRREWLGVGTAAIGLAFLAATVGSGRGAENHYHAVTLATYVGALALTGLLLAVTAGRGRLPAATLLALAAGSLWAGSDVTIKALSGRLGTEHAAVLFNPLALVILLMSLVGLSVSARSLQLGRAVAVIATTSAAANLGTIAAGPAVFGEPLPSGTAALLVRLGAFALVITAAVLTPAPQAGSGAAGAIDPRRAAPDLR